MTKPHFTAFVRIRPHGLVEDEVLADNVVQPPLTTQSVEDQPWVAPSQAEMDALFEEVVALAAAPLPLDQVAA